MCSMCHTQANGERDNPPIGQNREVGQALTQALCHVVIHLLEVVDEVRHKSTIHHCRRTELRTEIRLPSGSSSLVYTTSLQGYYNQTRGMRLSSVDYSPERIGMRLAGPVSTATPAPISRTRTGRGRAEARPYHKKPTPENGGMRSAPLLPAQGAQTRRSASLPQPIYP